MNNLNDQFNSLRQSLGRGQVNNVQKQPFQFKLSDDQVTNFLPMGRVSAFAKNYAKQLSPESIAQGTKMFQGMMRDHQIEQRALSERARAARAFKKIWPTGSSEQLLGKFVNKNPIFNPWK